MTLPRTRSDREYQKFEETSDGKVAMRTTASVAGSGYTLLETGELAPGASADGYDVKTTGGLFSTVVTSYRTIITNNDSAETIQLFINTDDAATKEISIGAGTTFEITSFPVTNLFIDTTASQSGTVEIILFG